MFTLLLVEPLIHVFPGLSTSISEGIKIVRRTAIKISTVSSTFDVENRHTLGLRSIRDKTKSVPWVNRTIEEDDLVGANITTTIIAVGVINRDCGMILINAINVLAHTKEVFKIDQLAERNIRALDGLIITILNTSLIHPGTTRSRRSIGISVLKLIDLIIIVRISAILTLTLEPLIHEVDIRIISITGGADDIAHLGNIPHTAKTIVITRVLDNTSNRVRKGFKEGGLIKNTDRSLASLEIIENLSGVALHKRFDGLVGLGKTAGAGRTNRVDNNLEVFREV